MSSQFELAQALYKAQLDFYQRAGVLLQENGKHWLELGSRRTGEAAGTQSPDVAAILERQLGETRAFAQDVTATQAALVSHLGEALRAWQQASVDAVRASTGDAQPTKYWIDLLNTFSIPFQPVSPPIEKTNAPRK